MQAPSDEIEEDLPDPTDLVHDMGAPTPRRPVSSDVDFSDPELDALILQMPSDEARTGKKAASTPAREPSSVGPKRKLSPMNDQLPAKRRREVELATVSSPTAAHTATKRAEPLFLPGSQPSSPGMDAYYDDIPNFRLPTPLQSPGKPEDPLDMEEEEFTLDESLFEIVPSTSSTIAGSSTYGGGHSRSPDPSTKDMKRAKVPQEVVEVSATANKRDNRDGQGQPQGPNIEEPQATSTYPLEEEDDYDDGIAAFDAWLASGAKCRAIWPVNEPCTSEQ